RTAGCRATRPRARLRRRPVTVTDRRPARSSHRDGEVPNAPRDGHPAGAADRDPGADELMRPMDHAEAHELLADLALEPSRVEIPAAAQEHERLRLHLETGETCRTDLEAWRNTHQAIEDALVTADGGRERLA